MNFTIEEAQDLGDLDRIDTIPKDRDNFSHDFHRGTPPVPSIVREQADWGRCRSDYTPSDWNALALHEKADVSVCAWARKVSPESPAKELADAAGCKKETARSWLKMKTGPGKKHLFRLMVSWGPEFIDYLMEPVEATFERNAKRRVRNRKNSQT